MATIRKLRNKWQAQVRLKGMKPIARSFDKKADAVDWACVTESKVTTGTYVDPRVADNISLSKLIDLYTDRVKQQGRVSGPEMSRLKRLRCALGEFSLSGLSVYNLSQYRDQRLLEANPATVIHELSLLLRLLRCAGTDFGIPLPQGVPSVRLPKMPRGRVRRLSGDEEQRLVDAANDDPELSDIIIVAINCATRRSELLAVQRQDIDLERRTLTLTKTKNGLSRVVPLPMAALEAFKRRLSGSDKPFSISASRLSQRFADISKKAGIYGLRFHDLRHEAVSRLFEMGLTTVEVAAISGHQSLSMLQRYTHIKPEHLVRRLIKLS
ncbi:site-specific integrase [Pseudohongiella sp. O18]|uniref:site-specific integrase n=1 Tax=Pseudohongiella sp. O18 TaxID=2904248 RepID=UPI001F2F5447|nr:site-specific integrase [Pseudohongiella sp. O18]